MEPKHNQTSVERNFKLQWVKFSDRKPTESNQYYWKGKSGYGGHHYYDAINDEWDWGNTPVNKVSDDYLYWLEEL